MSKTIHIVGSGLVGTLAAIIMARKGYSVELYERRADMRKGMADAGRSINLAVTARGFKALERVGLREHVLSIAIPMKGRMIHDPAGNLNLQPYGQKDDEVIYAASRSLLNMKLLDAADKENNIRIHFEKRCTDYDIATKTLTFTGGQGAESKVQADITIAADGAWSAVRKAMLGTVPNFNYSQSFLEYGYKELEIPAGPGGAFRMEKHALHIWPRNNYMLIALPNTDGSFTCTLFYPYEGQDSFARQKTEADVAAFFARDFADAVPMMPDLQKDFFGNPTGALVTVKCAPWHVGGQVLLLGDASHAIVPFFAQGMNSGFEDCTVLDEVVSADTTDWEAAFGRIEVQRKPNTDAIAQMALENFVEMRDSVANPHFVLRKKVGFALEQRFPERFIPRYSMVIFHPEIPYAEAQRLSVIQDGILDKLCANINDPEQLDWVAAEELVTALPLRA